jgi:transposase
MPNNVALKLWKGRFKYQKECLQMIKLLSIDAKQSTIFKNKLHGEAILGNLSKVVVRSLKRSFRQLK